MLPARSRMSGVERTTRSYLVHLTHNKIDKTCQGLVKNLQGRFLFMLLDISNDRCVTAPSRILLECFRCPASLAAFPVSNLNLSCCNLISLLCVLYTMGVENILPSVQDISYNIAFNLSFSIVN